jgi:hypothetical protein
LGTRYTFEALIIPQILFRFGFNQLFNPDQYPGEKGSVVSPFFGQNAQTMTLLVKLARKNKAVVGLCSDTTRAVISQQPKCGTNKIVFSSPLRYCTPFVLTMCLAWAL